MNPVTIAIVGTGFVADYYMTTLARHPGLVLAGAFDIDIARLNQFCTYHKVCAYADIASLLADKSIAVVVNLTTPDAHYEVSRAALEAGKHVYSEKPLATVLSEAEDLVELARRNGLTLGCAPANGLSDANRLVSEHLSAGDIGKPRLVYAEMEDGPVFREKWQSWKSRSGAVWPGVHEFEIGCTLEHAGYGLSWLVGLFGPVRELTSFSALTFPDKGVESRGHQLAPDFSVGCLTFNSGVVARLTTGLAAPRDRSMTILGDQGSITVRDLWDNQSTIHLEKTGEPRPLLQRLGRRFESQFGKAMPFKLVPGRRLKYQTVAQKGLPAYPSQIDFMAGVAAQARMINGEEQAFFCGAVSLHITELALALHNGHQTTTTYVVKNTF